ncbi:MAG TPA: hypothetical protein DCZ72_08810 [Armatimonadetes bacterium]|nr:hypothetical protein [Armatimonadota bacterium]
MVARAAGVAPASALLLGTGTIAGSRLTAWARAAGPGTGLVVPTAHGLSHGATGPDALDLSGYGLVADADPRLAAALAALPRAGGDMTGILGLIAGGLRLPRWPHFGPPTAGSADLLGLDRAGAWWLRDATSWRQMTAGTPLAWSGGGADDVTAAVNWAQGLADRYRAVDPGYGEWEWDPLIARWRGRVTTMVDQTARTIAASTLTASMPLDPDYDYAVVSGYWYYTVPDATGAEVEGFRNTIRGRSWSPSLDYVLTTDYVVPGSNWISFNVLPFAVQIPVIETATYRALEIHVLRTSVNLNWSITHRGVQLRLQDLRK